MSEEFNVEVSEDNLSARLSDGAIHVLADALVSCFKGSGAINHLECNFEDPDSAEQYTMLMQKKSGITQGEKIDRLKQENADLIAVLSNAIPAVASGFSDASWRVLEVHSSNFSRAANCFSLSVSAELLAPLRTPFSATAALLDNASTASCAAEVALSVNGASISCFVSIGALLLVAVAIINP